jgi:hypothetical protein
VSSFESPNKPSTLETLAALLRVTEAQEQHDLKAAAERRARVVTDETLLAAVKNGENTWERLHAYFPESQWRTMAEEAERLQRGGELHRDAHSVFRAGERKHPWKLAMPEPYDDSRRSRGLRAEGEPPVAPSWYSQKQRETHAKARGLPAVPKARRGAKAAPAAIVRPSMPPGTRRG